VATTNTTPTANNTQTGSFAQLDRHRILKQTVQT
jgi:hypothetical protein